MRKLVFSINLTLDGCCDHTKGIANDSIHNFFTQLVRDSGTFLYGRKTYELMVPFWPDMAKNPGEDKAINDFAQAFVSINDIVVFSRSMTNVSDPKTTIVKGDLREEISKLKQQQGKNILAGGVDLSSQLMQLGLVDEFHFVIQPVLVGKGRRLLEEFEVQEKLELVSSTVLKSGSVALHYINPNAAV